MSKPTISSCDDDNEPHHQARELVCSHMDYFNNEENCLWKNDDCQANSGASFSSETFMSVCSDLTELLER